MTKKSRQLSLSRPVENQLDQIAKNTVPWISWIWLLIFLLLAATLLIWSFMGEIEMTIEGKGIVLNTRGLFNIQTPVKGIALSLLVKPGNQVKEGQLVAEIYDAQKEMLLSTNQIKADNLAKEVRRLSREVEIETEASLRSLENQLASLEFDVKTLNERMQFLQKELDKKLRLYHEGLIIPNVVQDAERQISNVKISLEEKKGEIADIRSKLKKSYRTEELKTKELELLKAQEEVKVIQASLKQNQIYSPYDGTILEILVNPGEVVDSGRTLFNAEFIASQNHFLFYGFFPSELGKHVRKGSLMTMAPSTVNTDEYGTILSRVKEVSAYAVSEKAIVNQIHNANLAHYLSNHLPVTQVVAEPILDPHDPSGLAWTSGNGPSFQLSTGTVGEVETVIERVHPIYYLIPIKGFKETFYLEERANDHGQILNPAP